MISSKTDSVLLIESSDVKGVEKSEVDAEEDEQEELRRSMIEFSMSCCCCCGTDNFCEVVFIVVDILGLQLVCSR